MKRIVIVLTMVVAVAANGQSIEKLDPNFASVDTDGNIAWYDALTIGVEGQGWSDVDHAYDRLPDRAEGVVRPPIWSLSRMSAGLKVRFLSDSPMVAARWSVRRKELAMPHMPATGVSGLDLYAKDGDTWRWVAGGRPTSQENNEVTLVGDIIDGMHEYLLYLPLYNGTEKLEIGIRPDSTIAKGPERGRKPIVFYGSSITQGGCASRPGMSYPAILGRRLDYPSINLGFSGNGEMEMETGDFLAELDPCVFVLDGIPNMDEAQVAERFVPFIQKLRAARPETPIVVVECIFRQNDWFTKGPSGNLERNRLVKEGYEALRAEGMDKLYYVKADDYLGSDGQGTVDGVHPTDLGFMRQADTLEPVLREALGLD